MSFKEKIKEPILSPNMQNLIKRSKQIEKGDFYDPIILYKSLIADKLLSNRDILRTLHHEELESKIVDWDNPNGEIYKDVCVFDFLKIPGIQSTVKNYICYAVNEEETLRYNDDVMSYIVMFRTISHEDDFHTDWGVNRQDLLSAIIKYDFDWSNDLGMHLIKSYDRDRVYENGFYYREFAYEIKAPNGTQNKLRNGLVY